MKIEWWMLDGIVGLIVLAAAIRGAVKGIGSTFLKIAGFAGGLVLSVLYSGRLAEYLGGTELRVTLRKHILKLIKPVFAGDAAEGGSNALTSVVGHGDDFFADKLPKALGGIANSLENSAAKAAADRLTELALSVIAFILIILAIELAMLLIRIIIRTVRKTLPALGFLDRLLGFVLGIVRGGLMVCLVMAALVPVTAFAAPAQVDSVMEALHNSYAAGIIYDINPLMMLIRHFIL